MFKRNLTLMLVGALIFSMSVAPMTLAKSKEEKAAEFTSKVKTGIAKLGVGPEARVEVKLRDKTKLKGYISEATAETFSVTDLKTGATNTMGYPAVTQVKGNNLSTGAWIAIGVVATVGVLLLIILLRSYKS